MRVIFFFFNVTNAFFLLNHDVFPLFRKNLGLVNLTDFMNVLTANVLVYFFTFCSLILPCYLHQSANCYLTISCLCQLAMSSTTVTVLLGHSESFTVLPCVCFFFPALFFFLILEFNSLPTLFLVFLTVF